MEQISVEGVYHLLNYVQDGLLVNEHGWKWSDQEVASVRGLEVLG